DKRRARLNCIRHLLDLIPYEKLPRDKPTLPEREMEGAQDDRATLEGRRFVPEKFRGRPNRVIVEGVGHEDSSDPTRQRRQRQRRQQEAGPLMRFLLQFNNVLISVLLAAFVKLKACLSLAGHHGRRLRGPADSSSW